MQRGALGVGFLIAWVFFAGCASDPDDAASGDAAAGDAATPDEQGNASGGSSGGSHAGATATAHDAGARDAGGRDTAAPDAGPRVAPGDVGDVDVRVDVNTDQGRRAISPLIYGSNRSDELESIRYTVLRSGGNRLTAYNWENNASNAGSDWMFQNDNLLSASDTPAKAVTDMLDLAKSAGAAAIVTVPIVDYVAADKNGDGDVRNSGGDYLQERFKKNVAEKGAAFSDAPDADDDSVYQDEFVAYLKKRYGDAQVLFSLDNEPDLWSSTHAEVHPDPVTYAELWERDHRFAKAIKAAWPSAEVTGVVSYGYNGYVNLQNAPDAAGRDFLEWYLDRAKAAEAEDGGRVIDYLDLHWYPEARGANKRITEDGDEPDLRAAREQAPRSLWDPEYLEDSWIVGVTNGPIDLLHRVEKKIDEHYPGTKLAITEWNYGGGGDISGAIAAADVLGVFGREGVAMATEWPLAAAELYVEAAFRVYRNYDGAGATFGDTSVQARSADVERLTAYASVDSQGGGGRVVLVLINKADGALRAGAAIAHTGLSRAEVYRLDGSSADLVKGDAISASADNAFTLTLPAQSITVLVARP
jgi:hypothetical protein